MVKIPLDMGIEIECIIDNSLFSLSVGEYHGGLDFGLGGWDIQRDGSLYFEEGNVEEKKFKERTCMELVSKKVRGRDEFRKMIDGFIAFFSKKGKYELKEVISFNKSCGSHAHFSIAKRGLMRHKLHKTTYYKTYDKTRNLFYEKMRKSKIASKEQIISHYFRDYSRKNGKLGNFSRWKDERNSEFNILSDMRGQGIEWRGLNMLNIETWKEFKEFWKIVYECLEKCVEMGLKYEEQEGTNFAKKEAEELLKKVNEKVNLSIKTIKPEKETATIKTKFEESEVCII